MRRVADLTEPGHQEAHIHHAHWFALDPGNKEDNYTYGNTEWVFGNGDEETRADFQERSAADPKGPVYGQYVTPAAPQLMIYMLHNKTSVPLNVYIVLDVTFEHGTQQELQDKNGRPYHDISGVLFGRTYDIPREPKGDGVYESTKDSKRGADRVDLDDRRHDDRDGRPPAPRRAERDGREHGQQGEPLSGRRPGLRRHATTQVRRAVPKRRPVLRGLPDGGQPSGLAGPAAQGRPHPHHGRLREQGPRLVRRDDPRRASTWTRRRSHRAAASPSWSASPRGRRGAQASEEAQGARLAKQRRAGRRPRAASTAGAKAQQAGADGRPRACPTAPGATTPTSSAASCWAPSRATSPSPTGRRAWRPRWCTSPTSSTCPATRTLTGQQGAPPRIKKGTVAHLHQRRPAGGHPAHGDHL